MSPAEAEALGRRWLAAGGGWRDGMLAMSRFRTIRVQRGPVEGTTMTHQHGDDFSPLAYLDAWPDFTDAATRGAALEVVRERWGDAETYAKIEDSLWTKKRDGDGRRWLVITGDGRGIAVGDSEAEALVAALEAAPKEKP